MTLPANLKDLPELCACGKPLHYSDPRAREFVERCIAEQGDCLVVRCNGKAYRVQRHYLALHGVKAVDLEDLAALGIVERLEAGT